jgi:hypothetical protein
MRKRKQRTREEGLPQLAFSIPSFALAHDIVESSVWEEIRLKRLKARKFRNRTIITNEDGAEGRESLPLVGDDEP